MFAPPGYRPVFSVYEMTRKVAEKVGEEHKPPFPSAGVPENTSEPYEETINWVRQVVIKNKAVRFATIDLYLMQVPQIFVANSGGKVIEVSKEIITSNQCAFADDEIDYVTNRWLQYPWVDADAWVIDLKRYNDFIEESVERFNDLGSEEIRGIEITENKTFFDVLKEFEHWSLCVKESDFPKNETVLYQLWLNREPTKHSTISLPLKILEVVEKEGFAKADVRALFPNLSVRQFDHHWRLAAEKNPEISKPGRKS